MHVTPIWTTGPEPRGGRCVPRVAGVVTPGPFCMHYKTPSVSLAVLRGEVRMRVVALQFGRCAGVAAVLALSAHGVWAQQRADEAYTAQIRKYTTEPFFLT